jgi:tetratricopeptide (TPR) repeat protein
VLTLTDRTVDLETGEVSTGARLRPLELRLLSVLAQARGAVVSQSELLSSVFGYQPTVRTNTLYTTVHRLREKLERDPNVPIHLLSHRGEGYSLEGEARPAWAERGVPRTNLAGEVDAFVGRAGLLSQLQRLQSALVTLVGPGGAGKTRLAIHHALACAAPAVVMVPLEGEACALGAVASALQAPGSRWESVLERLGQVPGTLLLLDTAETKLSEVRELVEGLRREQPSVRLLVTSRLPLGLAGEQRLEVGPLESSEALLLLQQRMTELGMEMLPQDEALVELLEKLDGLPLAIELAAGWLAALPPAELLRRWQGLASTRADRPPRHRNLDATLDWTWALLSPEEQHASACLSALEGRFGLAAAQAALGSEVQDAAAMLVRLHERGLVTRPRLRGGLPFVQLHTVRLAVRHRAEPAALQQASQRVASFLIGRVAPIPGRPLDADQEREGAIAALREPARRDARAAVALCELLGQQGLYAEATQAAREALAWVTEARWVARLHIQLAALLRCQAQPAQALRSCEEVLDDPEGDSHLQAHAALEAGLVRVGLCEFEEAEAQLARIDGVLRQEGPEEHLLTLRGHRGRLAAYLSRCLGRPQQAVEELSAAERAYRQAGWVEDVAQTQLERGAALADAGQVTAGREVIADAMERLLALGAYGDAAKARAWAGALWVDEDPDRAESELRRAVLECRRTGQRWAELTAWGALSKLETQRGRWEEALKLVREVDILYRPGDPVHAWASLWQAEILGQIGAGRLLEAEALVRQRLQQMVELGVPVYHLRLAFHRAEILVALGRLDEAGELLESARKTCPPTLKDQAPVTLMLAELYRWRDDRQGALVLVRELLGQQLPMRLWCRASGLCGSLAAELGDLQGAALLDRAEQSLQTDTIEADGTQAAWLRVYRARIAQATGRPLPPAPPAPAHRLVLQRAMAELFSGPRSPA